MHLNVDVDAADVDGLWMEIMAVEGMRQRPFTSIL